MESCFTGCLWGGERRSFKGPSYTDGSPYKKDASCLLILNTLCFFFKLNVKQESDQQANRFGILFEDVDSILNVISVPKNTIIFVNKKVLVETLQ